MESWRNRKTLILSRTDMMGLVTPAEYVACVEQAYRMHGEGRYYMDPENTRTYNGFDLWTLQANYQIRRGGELFARVTNLLDKRYAEIVTYSAFTREQFTPGNPRTVYAGLRWSWQR